MSYFADKRITLKEITQGQDIPTDLLENLYDLWIKINEIRQAYGEPMIVTSGYRTVDHEKKKGRSGKSDHCKCKAIDIYDPDKKLCKWVHEKEYLLERYNLWVEHTDYTKNWIHFTTQPKSKRFFIP